MTAWKQLHLGMSLKHIALRRFEELEVILLVAESLKAAEVDLKLQRRPCSPDLF